MSDLAQLDPERHRRATSYDVARRAGVAQSTVSRCFAGDANISPATRKRVLDVADALGYQPNALARSLITQRSDLVGVIVARYTMRSNPDVVYALAETLAQHGKRLMLVPVEHDCAVIADLRTALAYPLAGLISCVLLPMDDLHALQRRRMPIVFFNRDPWPAEADSVGANHFWVAAELATTLHAAGHRRFLCVSGPPDAYVARQRQEGFLTRLVQLGCTPPPPLATDFSYDGGRAAFLDFAREKNPRPDAVFCCNDQIAMGVLDACRFELGWRVPQDLSVVGFDDVAEAARPSYDLTTFRQHEADMARQAVTVLLHRLSHPDAPMHKAAVPATLVRRGSARLD